VNDVVFPCGQTIGEDGDTINLYYGAADSSVALATGSLRCLLSWLDANCLAGVGSGLWWTPAFYGKEVPDEWWNDDLAELAAARTVDATDVPSMQRRPIQACRVAFLRFCLWNVFSPSDSL
jgi:hypothetical protein